MDNPKHREVNLSIAEARKLALLSQRLPSGGGHAHGAQDALDALSHLGYVQLDTISVVQRAHHHTFWNRARRYQPQHLTQLLRERKVFEYWSHAAAVLPMESYRFSLPLMRAYAAGKRHWHAPDRAVMRRVLARIKTDGALTSRDFDGVRKGGMWDWKPAKRALEQLFMEGKLMTAERRGFVKVYDLAERVLPARINTATPSPTQYARFLITSFLRANGVGNAAEIAYLRTAIKPTIVRALAQMTRDGELLAVDVHGCAYYALPDSLALLSRPLARTRAKILSPFDNFLIQRKRINRLFDFDYQIECYLPAHKRKHGYFCLPVLWGGALVARIDCKAERVDKILRVRNLVGEADINPPDKKQRFAESLAKELIRFCAFNECAQIKIDVLPDKKLRAAIRDALRRA